MTNNISPHKCRTPDEVQFLASYSPGEEIYRVFMRRGEEPVINCQLSKAEMECLGAHIYEMLEESD